MEGIKEREQRSFLLQQRQIACTENVAAAVTSGSSQVMPQPTDLAAMSSIDQIGYTACNVKTDLSSMHKLLSNKTISKSVYDNVKKPSPRNVSQKFANQ